MLASAMIAIMTETNNASDHSLLWGYSIEFWDRFGIRSLIWGALLGVVALLLTTASAYILYRVADVAQKELGAATRTSAEQVARLNNDTARLQAENLALQAVMLPRHVGLFTRADGGPSLADTYFAPMAEFSAVQFTVSPVDDSEARNLANEIVLALAYAGIRAKIDDSAKALNPTTVNEGLVVLFARNNPLVEKAGNALADALTNVGLGVGDKPVFRHGIEPLKPKDIESGLVSSKYNGVVVTVGQRPVAQTIARLNRERSKPTENPTAAKPEAK